jgi:hypothetical protein
VEILHHRTVTFYGDTLIAVQAADGAIYVPLGRMCDNLGLNRQRQMERIGRHPVLSQGISDLEVPTEGGPQAMRCLRVDLLPLWLAGVNANRVSEEIRAKLVKYQAEAGSVLWAAFKHDILPSIPLQPTGEGSSLVPHTEGLSGAQLAYEIATAVQALARQQLAIEQRLEGVDQRIQGMARWAGKVEQHLDLIDHRLDTLEIEVSPAADISEDQAAELALAVKAVGQALTARGEANGYQRVYGELYRRYSITSYKRLPRDRFTAVMEWLHAWHQELTGGEE